MLEVCINNSLLQRYEQNLDNMWKLPICERTNLKSFIKVLKTYGLNQKMPTNKKGVTNSRLETQVLVYQREQTLQLTIAKKEVLQLDQETAHTRLTKEEVQEHDHQ